MDASSVATPLLGAEEPDLEKSARAALTKLSQSRGLWLLVYDNVTDPQEIADLLPAAGARLLITSRFSDWAGWAEEVPIDVLPMEEAVALLRLGTAATESSDQPNAEGSAICDLETARTVALGWVLSDKSKRAMSCLIADHTGISELAAELKPSKQSP